MPCHELIDLQERLADRAGEREVALQIAFQVVVEDAADTALLIAMRQMEIFVRPCLES